MTRKTMVMGLMILVLVTGLGSGLWLFLRHEPDFFRQASLPAGDLRKQRCREFQAGCMQVAEHVINQDRHWQVELTADQINSYLEEDFIRAGTMVKSLPEGISDPRLAIEPDRLRLAFRYQVLGCKTVVSIDMCPWLPAKEPNVMALKIQGLKAGALPISAQSLLEKVSDVARRHDIDVTWYRHEGQPVALLRFQADQKRPTVQLRQLDLHQGRMVVGGGALLAPPRSGSD